MRKVRAGVSLDRDLYEKLRKMAEEDRRSISSLINALLHKVLEKDD